MVFNLGANHVDIPKKLIFFPPSSSNLHNGRFQFRKHPSKKWGRWQAWSCPSLSKPDMAENSFPYFPVQRFALPLPLVISFVFCLTLLLRVFVSVYLRFWISCLFIYWSTQVVKFMWDNDTLQFRLLNKLARGFIT